MAFPNPPGLTPSEVAFLCEMELVTIVPRQRLERLDLLGGPSNALIPPTRTTLPFWLALLLKRQKRVNLVPPPWLDPENLRELLELETTHFQDEFTPAPPLPSLTAQADAFPRQLNSRTRNQPEARLQDAEGKHIYLSEPFLNSCTATGSQTALPYHWYEFSTLFLDAAPDDLQNADAISNLLRDIREVRQAKMRRGYTSISDGSDTVRLNGVGAMEISESRGFIMGVMRGLRSVGGSREQARREAAEEERENRARQDEDDEDEDEDMM